MGPGPAEVAEGFKELAETLSRYGHGASADLPEDRFVVVVVFQGRPAHPDLLVALLGDEVDDRERVLSANGGDAGGPSGQRGRQHLQELIAAAEHQVRR